MSWGPIVPARIAFDDPAAPTAPDFADVYHSRAGAWGQARHVFLGGNGLPARWAGRAHFAILETGFGVGNNFLATWAAWRDDRQRPGRLHYVAIEKHPPRREDLARALRGSLEPALAAELVERWPPLTPDLHLLDFAGGRVRLLLALGDIDRVLPEIAASFDAFYLDGFAPARNPAMWDPWLLRGLHRLAAPGATLATWCVASAVRQALTRAGFEVTKAPGFGDKREMTIARHAPRVAARAPPGRAAHPARTVAVIGAGLAGAAAARALAGHGLAVQVFERRSTPAAETSGQPGGLLHGVVHAADGEHARWLRVAAIHAARDLAPRLAAGRVSGALDGLWRGETRSTPAAMLALIERLALPADYVRADRLPGGGAAWLYPAGGWAGASALSADWLLDHRAIERRFDTAVRALAPSPDGRWQLCGDNGAALATADAVVLANACDLPRLWPAATPWLDARRAQTSWLPADAAQPMLVRPIADAGYVLRLTDGRLLFGAASAPVAVLADADALNHGDTAPTAADHERNLATLARLTGWHGGAGLAARLDGRTGVRLQTLDRLPLVGPLPAGADALAGLRLDQPRLIPRLPGLYALGAFGSRGLTQAALAGEVLAAWLAGTPVPAPATLLDAIDPARFIARAARAAAGAQNAALGSSSGEPRCD